MIHALLLSLMASTGLAAASGDTAVVEWHDLVFDGTEDVRFAVCRPADSDPRTPCPVLLALLPGDATEARVAAELERFARTPLASEWIVVAPAQGEGLLFPAGMEPGVTRLIDAVASHQRIEGGRVHVLGPLAGRESVLMLPTHRSLYTNLASLCALSSDAEEVAAIPDRQLYTDLPLSAPAALVFGGAPGLPPAGFSEVAARLNRLCALPATATFRPIGAGRTPASSIPPCNASSPGCAPS